MRDWYDAGEPKPRVIDRMPRCANCSTRGMYHPLHRDQPCILADCQCTKPELFIPGSQRP